MTPKPKPLFLVHTFYKSVGILSYYLHADSMLTGGRERWWQLGPHWEVEILRTSWVPLLLKTSTARDVQYLLIRIVVQLLSHVWLFCDPMDCSTLGFPVLHHLSLLRLMSIESVMPSNHLLLFCPLLLLPSIFLSIRVFSRESALHIRWPKYWSFTFSISPSNEYSELISFRIDWLDVLAVQGTLKSLPVLSWPNLLLLIIQRNLVLPWSLPTTPCSLFFCICPKIWPLRWSLQQNKGKVPRFQH